MRKSLAVVIGATFAASSAPPVGAQTLAGGSPLREEAAPSENDPAEDRDGEAGEDIVVTASRRAERLRDVPSSITALQGDRLNELGGRTTNDFLSLVPGASFRDIGAPGQGTVIIRGLFAGSQQVTNTTATYIDDVPFSASGYLSAGALLSPDPEVVDLERFEVLKGPQGTLYGANSLGGLARLVSKQPDLSRATAFAQIEGTSVSEGGLGFGFRGSLNVPLLKNTLAVRVNGIHRRVAGFIDNIATGEKDFDYSIIEGVRASLRWQPSPELTLDLNGMLQNIRNNGLSYQSNAGGTLDPSAGRYEYSGLVDVGSNLRYRIGAGTLSYDTGPVALSATASYAEYRTRNFSDYTDSSYSYARTINPVLSAVLPSNGSAQGDFSPNMEKWTAEIRGVSSRLEAFEFVVGGFFTDERNVYDTRVIGKDESGAELPGTFSNGVPVSNLIYTRTLSDYREIAGFFSGTIYVTEDFDIGGGLRYARNSQRAATSAIEGASTFYALRPRRDYEFDDAVATYLATLRYRPSSQISLYLRAASGYRPGGPQTNSTPPPGAQPAVNADTTWNYEGGIKASLGRFSIDASAYHIDWNDIQLNTSVGGILLGANGGKADVDGFELSMVARPHPSTTFSANVGYTDARVVEVDPGVQAVLGVRPKDRLPLTPDWTVSLIGDQTLPLAAGLDARVGTTLRFRSGMPNGFPKSAVDPDIRIPSLTTIDLRASVQTGEYSVQLRVENVFDSFGYNLLSTPRIFAGQPVTTRGALARPRTVALTLSVEL